MLMPKMALVSALTETMMGEVRLVTNLSVFASGCTLMIWLLSGFLMAPLTLTIPDISLTCTLISLTLVSELMYL